MRRAGKNVVFVLKGEFETTSTIAVRSKTGKETSTTSRSPPSPSTTAGAGFDGSDTKAPVESMTSTPCQQRNHLPRPMAPVQSGAISATPSLTSAPVLPDTIERLSRSGRWFWLVTLHPKNPPEIFERYRAMQGPHLRFVDSGRGILPPGRRLRPSGA